MVFPFVMLFNYKPCHYSRPPFFCDTRTARLTRRKSHTRSSAMRLTEFVAVIPSATQTAVTPSESATCSSTDLRLIRLRISPRPSRPARTPFLSDAFSRKTSGAKDYAAASLQPVVTADEGIKRLIRKSAGLVKHRERQPLAFQRAGDTVRHVRCRAASEARAHALRRHPRERAAVPIPGAAEAANVAACSASKTPATRRHPPVPAIPPSSCKPSLSSHFQGLTSSVSAFFVPLAALCH